MPSPPSSAPPTAESIPADSQRGVSGRRVVIVRNDVFGPLTVGLTDVLDVELVSFSYHPDRSIAPWQTPISSSTDVLAPTGSAGLPPCPSHATCTAFAAVGQGVASITIVGPTGAVCNSSGANCVEVASIAYSIEVTVVGSHPTDTMQIQPSTVTITRLTSFTDDLAELR